MTAGAFQALTSVEPELIAEGLGFPEGPVAMPDGSFVCVDSYRGQLTNLGADRIARPLAWTGGAPNSCVVGDDGVFYVCQNGGTTGPWRAAEMIEPSIQVVAPGGKAEALITEVDGIKLNGPNDLCFAGDGSLIFSDPGTYSPANPDPSFIYRILPEGVAQVLVAFPKPVFPNGVAVEADGSILWDESYTGHIGRRRPDGSIEDLGRPVAGPSIPDGLKVGADGRIYVADFLRERNARARAQWQSFGLHLMRRSSDQLRVWRRELVGHGCWPDDIGDRNHIRRGGFGACASQGAARQRTEDILPVVLAGSPRP